MSKVVLSVGLIFFTFIVMLGGNPKGDRFGFRYWNNPGSFAEYYKTGDLGRWLGFLACLIQASFTIAGPDYVSMAAGEAMNPRGVLPRAYNGIFYRITAFFVLGVLCVGILVPYNDPVMAAAFEQDLPGAAASPYVVAMDRLQIPVLPHIVNAVVLLAAFSAGNSYVYCASRSLYGLALDGKAPRILTTCTKAGVPVYCVMIVLLIALLSFLQVSNGSAVVLNWFVNLVSLLYTFDFTPSVINAYSYPGHCISIDQLLRHNVHLHPIQKSFNGTRRPPPITSVPEPRPALRCLHCPGIDIHHDLRGRIHGLSAWQLGHTHILLFVHNDRSVPDHLCRMETLASHKVPEP